MPGKHTRITTHCPYGHEYTPENTGIVPSGGKRCLECRRLRKSKEPFPILIDRANRRSTHCRYGHEYTQENTYINPKTGARDCRTCRKESSIKWKLEHPDRTDEHIKHKLRKYDLSVEEYEKMFDRQNGKCYICGEPHYENRPLHVDHCHSSNKVRALLCFNCNRGLGCYKDSPELMIKAARYLQEFQ